MKKENIQTLEEFITKHFGEIGTKKRNMLEKEFKILDIKYRRQKR